MFVAPDGVDTNPGTKDAPVATVRAAMRLAGFAKRPRVVLAEGKYTENAPLMWVDGVTVVGGFSRSTWARGEGTSELSGATLAVVATRLTQGGTLAHVVIRAKGAASPDQPSVALWVSDLPEGKAFRVEDGSALYAGAGGDGAPGADARYPGALDGARGGDGRPGSVDGEIDPGTGGSGGRNPSCPEANGGSGGSGGHNYSGFRGIDGRPSAGGVAGGKGADANGCTARDGTSAVAKAAPGGAGAAGAGAGDLGEWDEAAFRYVPPAAQPGTPGQPGQGGGGGGGGSGQSGTFCNDGAGGGGGGGGAGGCGGLGGAGGGSGGPSVALLVLKATVVVDGAKLATERGGAGGQGGAGEAGGEGGAAGAGATQGAPEIGRGAKGEAGAAGGSGGRGGSGSGGPSVGLWVLSGNVQTASVQFEVGPGGSAGGAAGLPGRRAERL